MTEAMASRSARVGALATLGFERMYVGKSQVHGLEKNIDARKKTVGDYTVSLSKQNVRDGTFLRFEIADTAGKPVVLEPYLGARGHAVILSEKGDYIHAHDVSGEYVGGGHTDDPLDFLAPKLPDRFYRAFTQFQANGRVYTVEFDL